MLNFFFIFLLYRNNSLQLTGNRNIQILQNKNNFIKIDFFKKNNLKKYFYFFQKILKYQFSKTYFHSLSFYKFSYPYFNKKDYSLFFLTKKISTNMFIFTNIFYDSLINNNNHLIIDPLFFKENTPAYYSFLFGSKIFKNFK